MAPVLYKIRLNLYTTATLGIEEGGRCRYVVKELCHEIQPN